MSMRIRAYEFKPGEPPAEIQLWDVGDNATDYGVHKWTKRSAREVMARYEERGNPLQIDVDHNCAEPPKSDEPPPTGGYARLELRDGAPWLVFDWSAYAIEQIASRQRLFLSPEYLVDKKTNEIVRLIRVSLVGSPGTHHARMLASSARMRIRAGGKQMDPTLLAALKAILEAEDPKEALGNLLAELEAGSGDTPPQEPATTESDAAPAEPSEEEDKAAAKAKASAQSGQTSPEVMAMAKRLAELEAENKARAKREQLAKEEQEAEARVAAAANKIPEYLRAFAKKLSKADFEEFVKDLPEQPTKGIRASSTVTQGDKSGAPEGELPDEDARHMNRIFGNNSWQTEAITKLPNGHVRASHLTKKGG